MKYPSILPLPFSLYFVVLLFSFCFAQKPSLQPEKEAKAASVNEKNAKTHLLGERMLQALKDDNLIAFSKCWAPASVQFYSSSGIASPTDFSDVMRFWQLRRDMILPPKFAALRAKLLDITEGDLNRLAVDDVLMEEVALWKIPPDDVQLDNLPDSIRSSRMQFKKAENCYITLRMGRQTIVRLAMGGAFSSECLGIEESNSRIRWFWYFAEKPLTSFSPMELIKDGTKEEISLDTKEYADVKRVTDWSVPIPKPSSDPTDWPQKEILENCAKELGNTSDARTYLLGERMLQALKDDNIVAFAKCWIPWSIKNYLETGKEKPSEFPWERHDQQVKIDRAVEYIFPRLRKKLIEITDGDLGQLRVFHVICSGVSLHRIPPEDSNQEFEAVQAEQTQFKMAKECHVCFRTNNMTLIVIPMGTAFTAESISCKKSQSEINSFWYFSGRPGISTGPPEPIEIDKLFGNESIYLNMTDFLRKEIQHDRRIIRRNDLHK